MTTIADLFERSVTRDIPPVVYFHETTPENIQREVDEYIVTGGYPEGDHRRKRVERGIHEEYVRLLTAIDRELENWSGSEPASWISGFYGSGKSSFAKMLGLALDSPELPDGRPFADAWLARNQTPRREELARVWAQLHERVKPVSVIFDVGGSARDEPIHITILREALKRFGYAVNPRVAAFELKLEADSYYDAFLETYSRLYDHDWTTEGRTKRTSDTAVSAVMHQMQPERYDTPTAWRLMYGREEAFNMGPNDVSDWLAHILKHRAKGKTLFLVVDEVSQYVVGNNARMLHLQSFNSALAHLRGKVWLLATGQQKLEEQDASTELGKLKGRFPVPLRVHLGEQNIREVVHKRLLKKTPAGEQQLRGLFQGNHTNLKLYAYDCQEITEEDFVEVYPLLPGHISLLLDITTQIRHRSTRLQGDSHSVRGLMQLLGDLFRERDLASKPIGALIGFDDIYDIQASSLDVDTQRSMEKVRHWAADNDDTFAHSVARAVALLQLIQEEKPTTIEFIAQCLYDRVDRGPTLKEDVRNALDRLKNANPPLVSYSERTGYRLESSARAEWNGERDAISVPTETLFEAIKERLQFLLDVPAKPRLKDVQIPFEARFTDSRGHVDVWLKQARGQAAAPLDFRFLAQSERSATAWINRSSEGHLRDRLIWVAGDVESVDATARKWAQSRQMVKRYAARRESLSLDKQQILLQEKAEEEQLARRLEAALRNALMEGSFYFRGREIAPRDMGDGFGTALEHTASNVLEDLYPHFTNLTVSQGEIDQLFKDSLAGASKKFFADKGGLGLLDYDAGEIVASCPGSIPQQLLRTIKESRTVSGSHLFETFSGIPYGYGASVIKACLLGLLRGGHIEIRPRGGGEITSYYDAGTQDLFAGDRDLKSADFALNTIDDPIGPSDLVKICKVLDPEFNTSLDRDVNSVAEAVFAHFPSRVGRLREVRDRLRALGTDMPVALEKLETAFTACTSSRDVQGVVRATLAHLDALRDGFQQLNLIRQELTDDAVSAIKRLRRVLSTELAQLTELGPVPADVAQAGARITEHLALERPWREIATFETEATLIRDAYITTRSAELATTGAAIEDARDSVKVREGFDTLKPDDSNHVLRPFALVLPDTDAESTTPTLTVIRAKRGTDLQEALAESHARLDEILGTIVVVDPKTSGRVIGSQAALEALLGELRTSISQQLSAGKKVRLE